MKLSSRVTGEVLILDVEGKILLGEGDVEIKQVIDEHLAQGRKKFLLNLAKVPVYRQRGPGSDHPGLYGHPESGRLRSSCFRPIRRSSIC